MGEYADIFYVGNKGSFDRIAHRVLKDLKYKYPYIKVYVVLDYIPTKKVEFEDIAPDTFETIIPDEIESVPKRFAISFRNRWMVNACDIAVVFYQYSSGNTKKHVDMLKRKSKPVINIADMVDEENMTEE